METRPTQEQVKEIGEGAEPVVSQEQEAQQKLETRKQEMGQLMTELETARASKGNFCVTISEGDSRNIVFIEPVEGVQTTSGVDATREMRQLKTVDYVFVTKDGFRAVSFFTEAAKNPAARQSLIIPQREAQYIERGFRSALQTTASKDGRIELPEYDGEQPLFAVARLLKRQQGERPIAGNPYGFFGKDNEPDIVVSALRKSIEAAQAPHIKAAEVAEATAGNVGQAMKGIRKEI